MFCKAMALKPVGSKIKIPQHKFMGHSKTLMIHLERMQIELNKREMLKAFKSIRF